MTWIDYLYSQSQLGAPPQHELGKRLERSWRADPPFYGVVMVAMRRADTDNLAKLCAAWPAVYAELCARYDAPAGLLDSDPSGLREQVLRAVRGEGSDDD